MRQLLLAAALSLKEDVRIDSFSHPLAGEVSFLAKVPGTYEEIAENLWERIRAAGLDARIIEDDIDLTLTLAVKQIREESDA